jgi:hypothetical protein
MANLTSTTITGTLDTTSTITGPASGASALNASNVSSGTLASDRLPTVPTTKGGTGLTSVGSTGQVLTVTAPGALAFQDAAGGGGGYKMTVFTSPGTWTKPADVKDLKVTVVGGGGSAGAPGPGGCASETGGAGGGGGAAIEYLPIASVPGPVAVTIGAAPAGIPGINPGNPGGTSSFGAFLSATGGLGGCRCGCDPRCPQSNGGTGSGGNINTPGGMGAKSRSYPAQEGQGGVSKGAGGAGGTILTASHQGKVPNQCPAPVSFFGGSNTGHGGPIPQKDPAPFACTGCAGQAGTVIVEEFF